MCRLHSGEKYSELRRGVDPNLLRYRFLSASQRNIWALQPYEKAISFVQWYVLICLFPLLKPTTPGICVNIKCLAHIPHCGE